MSFTKSEVVTPLDRAGLLLAVKNDPNKYLDAISVHKGINIISLNNNNPNTLNYGDIVERHIQCGDEIIDIRDMHVYTYKRWERWENNIKFTCISYKSFKI